MITGITGQDGSYLAELLLTKGYEVHGLRRPASLPNTSRIDHLLNDPAAVDRLVLHQGDLTDGGSLLRILHAVAPDEVYNLAAQSDVAASFEMPEYTADVNAMGTLRLLEAIRTLGLAGRTRFYQAATSELFGLALETPQRESTPFRPRSPYAAAKLHAYWTTVSYREAYGLHASNGILFNHESPRRGECFVTRKITRGLCAVALGRADCLTLGNLSALRDWGHCRDYVTMQWLMLQQDAPGDYVIATGEQHSVRDFVRWAGEELGLRIAFSGQGAEEIGIVVEIAGGAAPAVRPGQVVVRVDPALFRPAEVPALLGDPSKAFQRLGWRPATDARALCAEMVAEDLAAARAAGAVGARPAGDAARVPA